MSTKSRQGPRDAETLDIYTGKEGMWGLLAGVVTGVLIALPLSASFAFATHPFSQRLFGGELADASRAGFSAFWWLLTLLFAALPFVVGFGVAKLHGRSLAILAGAVAVLVIVLVVLGQLYVF
ncbi:hypothetical protein ACUWEX_02545 [Okibacterium fritillariae]|uniref:hypothetical protein n=1 Tax=Okibacterium fritillariae TaxID=123320 RepID=UPI004055699D